MNHGFLCDTPKISVFLCKPYNEPVHEIKVVLEKAFGLKQYFRSIRNNKQESMNRTNQREHYIKW